MNGFFRLHDAIALSRDSLGMVEEPIPKSILQSFSLSPHEYGWELQRKIITAKVKGAISLRESSAIVMDRLLSEDREVFLKMHFQLGYLNVKQLEELKIMSHRR